MSIRHTLFRLFSIVYQVFKWLVLFLLLFYAVNVKDPHLLHYRAYSVAVIIALTLVGLLILHWRPSSRSKIATQLMLIATLLCAATAEVKWQYHKHQVLATHSDIAAKIGAHFIIGYNTPDQVYPLIEQGLIGGLFVTRENARGKSFTELQQEISEFQRRRHAAGLPPLIISSDQEGGLISRLSPPLPQQEGLNQFAEMPDRAVKAEAYGLEQGQALASLGINLNFSPVLDLKNAQMHNKLDFSSLINQRAISDDPEIVAETAGGYVRGLEKAGVTATLKHFPGLGNVKADTHHFSANSATPIEQLETHDWIPFQRIAQSSSAVIMLAHVTLTALDADNPASFSERLIQQIIRKKWAHNGLLITDDLTMEAAYQHGMCNVPVKAMNAGVDLLLVSFDHDKYYDAMYCALAAYQNGEINQAPFTSSQQRLQAFLQHLN